MKKLVLVLLCLFMVSPCFAGFQNGQKLATLAKSYLSSRGSDNSNLYIEISERGEFMGYVLGVYDMWSVDAYILYPEAYQKCLGHRDLTVGQLCEIAARYIINHPEKWDQSGNALIIQSFVQAFNCNFETSTKSGIN